MKQYRNFFSKDEGSEDIAKGTEQVLRDKDGYVHVAMTTYIFNEVSKNLLATNSMYASMLTDVKHCVEPYSTKEKIVLDIYDTHQVDDLSVQTVTYGFKNYVNSCLIGAERQQKAKFFLFFAFFLIGLAIEVSLYVFLTTVFPIWLFKTFEVLANLFIWQFGGHLAFEFFPERKKIQRYKQILNTKINVKHWD